MSDEVPVKPSAKRPPKQEIDISGGKFTDYENYTFMDVHRSQLKNAPYNPRIISDSARKKLKANLDKKKGGVGLLEPIVWNERTGYILSGHQRVSVLDMLERTRDYRLHVARVDLDDQTEKAQNIYMNNPLAQGEFDINKLEELIKVDKIDFEKAGYTLGELMDQFGDAPIINQPEVLADLAQAIRDTQAIQEEMWAKTNPRDSIDFYFVAVFPDKEKRDELLQSLFIEGDRFIDGTALRQKLIEFGVIEVNENEYESDEEKIVHLLHSPIKDCPRCGGSHRKLIFTPITFPTATETHYAWCPSHSEPFFKAFSEEEVIELRRRRRNELNLIRQSGGNMENYESEIKTLNSPIVESEKIDNAVEHKSESTSEDGDDIFEGLE